jgi:MFS family permease
MLPLFIAVFLMRFAFSFTVVSLQYIVGGASNLGIISSTYPIMEMISGFFIGIFADKFGRKWLISVGLLISAGVSLAFTFYTDPVYLAIIHGIQGVCASAIIVSSLALLTDLAKNTARGRDMGAYDFFTIAGYGLGFFAALIIIGGQSANARIPFYLGSVAALVGGIFSIIVMRDTNVRTKIVSIKENFKLITENRSTQTLLPTWFVLMTIVGVFLTFTTRITDVLLPPRESLATHAVSNLRLDAALLVLAVVGLILLGFSQTSLGALSDRFGRARIALIGQVSLMGILAVLIGLLAFHLKLIYALPFVALFGAGLLAFTPSALAELADAAPVTGRGSTMGIYSISVGAGTIFGPLAGGILISEYGVRYGLSILFGIGILIVLVFLIPRVFQFSRNV